MHPYTNTALSINTAAEHTCKADCLKTKYFCKGHLYHSNYVSLIKGNILSALDPLLNENLHYQLNALIQAKKFRTKITVLLTNLF